MTSVLMVLTGARTWTMKDGTPHPTGFWAEEFIKPHRAFTEAGFEVSIGTPEGVTPMADPLSLSDTYYKVGEIADQQAYLEAQADTLGSTLKLEEVEPDPYDVIFIVGGHGPMQDLAVHRTIGDLLAAMLDDENKTVASVCHGPASFLSAHRTDGTWLFKDRHITSFTNEEETQATFAGNAPWLLEDRLRLAGARFDAHPAWEVHVVEDGNLITGQNQNSAEEAAKTVLRRLRSHV
jgi:putative intracellular protease/amidase